MEYDDTPEFTMFPRILPRGWDGELIVSGETTLPSRFRRVGFAPDKVYRCRIAPRAREWHGPPDSHPWFAELEVKSDAEGRVRVPALTADPGEYLVRFGDPEDERGGYRVAQVGYYVLEDELQGLRPCLGDLHVHSTASDGRREPIYAVLRGRQRGYDFIALTDHNCYASSLEAISVNERELGMDMLILPGEECHGLKQDPARPDFHIVGIGHRQGIVDVMRSDPQKRQREVAAIARELADRYDGPPMDLLGHAHTLWTVRKIHELGGVAIYAHPYWQAGEAFYTFNQEREITFVEQECDGVEVLTDITTEEVMLQVSRAYSEAAAGREWTLIGSSDAHDVDRRMKYGWTMAFVRELSLAGVQEAIRKRRCLACSGRFADVEIFGPFSLMPFACFYHRRVWPLRRRIMELQAALGLSLRRGGAFDRSLMERLNVELQDLDARLWA